MPERSDPDGRAPAQLTDTQQRVLGLLCEGLSNREIAELLFLSTDTIKTHLSAIYRKIGVTSRGEAIATTLRTRWTMPADSFPEQESSGQV